MESGIGENVNSEKIRKAVLSDIQRANDYYTSKIEPVLRLRHQIYEADRAYYRKRFPEVSKQSDFVSFDFWSLVQWAIPSVMNSFFGGDDAVVIVGRNEEDVPRAELLKELVNFQIMTQNKGFLVLWDWFSDAFQYNLGAVKVWWKRIEDWQTQKLEYVGYDRLMMLQNDQWCQVEYAEGPDFYGMYRVIYRIGRLKENRPVIEPVRDPFRVLAPLSLSEIVGEVQTIKTALMRQLLVNIVNQNNARWFIDETKFNIKDVMENRQYIRTKGNPGGIVYPFPQAGLSGWTMPLFEYLEGALEQWTGRTRYNQGTDSKSLNKTATGISLLQQASEQRIDYIVRVFAETGVGEVMRFLVELNQRYIDQPQVIRLKNEMLEVSPDDLSGEFDIDVNTEAGIGKRRQTIENLQYYMTQIAPYGMSLGALTPGEWAKAAQKLLHESGIRDPQSYVKDPEQVKQEFFMSVQQQMQAQQAQAQEDAQTADQLKQLKQQQAMMKALQGM